MSSAMHAIPVDEKALLQALDAAAEAGEQEFVDSVLKHRLAQMPKTVASALLRANVRGDAWAQAVRLLEEKCPLDEDDLVHALDVAAEKGEHAFVDSVLENRLGFTPKAVASALLRASVKGNAWSQAMRLIKQRGLVDEDDLAHALEVAVERGRQEFIVCVLEDRPVLSRAASTVLKAHVQRDAWAQASRLVKKTYFFDEKDLVYALGVAAETGNEEFVSVQDRWLALGRMPKAVASALLRASVKGDAWARAERLIQTQCPLEDDDFVRAIDVAAEQERHQFLDRVLMHRLMLRLGQVPKAVASALLRASVKGDAWAWAELLIQNQCPLEDDDLVRAIDVAAEQERHPFLDRVLKHRLAQMPKAVASALLRASVKGDAWARAKLLIQEQCPLEEDDIVRAIDVAVETGRQEFVVSVLDSALVSSVAVSRDKFVDRLLNQYSADAKICHLLADRMWKRIREVESGTSRLEAIIHCHTPHWQYERKDGWISATPEACAILELAHAGANFLNMKPFDISVGESSYIIDLQKMTQCNRQTGRIRKIRRTATLPDERCDVVSSEYMQDLLRSRLHGPSPGFPDSKCYQFHGLEVVDVQLVTCPQLRSSYEYALWRLKAKHCRFDISVKPVESSLDLQMHKVGTSFNEGFFFHGTDAQGAAQIAKFGFDERYSKGIYGDGLYFTPHACKALQYAKPTHGVHTLLIARVALGDAYEATATRPGCRIAPQRADSEPGVLYDSVIVRPGRVNGAPGGKQQHTEVVIFDGAQTCPVYIVQVRCPHCLQD